MLYRRIQPAPFDPLQAVALGRKVDTNLQILEAEIAGILQVMVRDLDIVLVYAQACVVGILVVGTQLGTCIAEVVEMLGIERTLPFGGNAEEGGTVRKEEVALADALEESTYIEPSPLGINGEAVGIAWCGVTDNLQVAMVTEGLAATVHTAVIIYISVHHISTTPLGTDGALRMFGQIGIHLGIALGYARMSLNLGDSPLFSLT